MLDILIDILIHYGLLYQKKQDIDVRKMVLEVLVNKRFRLKCLWDV